MAAVASISASASGSAALTPAPAAAAPLGSRPRARCPARCCSSAHEQLHGRRHCLADERQTAAGDEHQIHHEHPERGRTHHLATRHVDGRHGGVLPRLFQKRANIFRRRQLHDEGAGPHQHDENDSQRSEGQTPPERAQHRGDNGGQQHGAAAEAHEHSTGGQALLVGEPLQRDGHDHIGAKTYAGPDQHAVGGVNEGQRFGEGRGDKPESQAGGGYEHDRARRGALFQRARYEHAGAEGDDREREYHRGGRAIPAEFRLQWVDEQRPGIDEPEEHEQHEGDEEVQQTVRRCVGHGSPLEIAFLMSCQPPSV